MKEETGETEKKVFRYGILGGTFDPIHNGHLYIAQTVLEELELDRIIFMPNYVSPHKLHDQVTEAEHRVQMVKWAIAGNEAFQLSTKEIYRQGPSYTIDTIRQLIQDHPDNTAFYFIAGADVFFEFEAWKSYEELIQLVHFVIASRAGHEHLAEKIRYFENRFNGQITRLEIPSLEISSTHIRRKVKEGKKIQYLVPAEVVSYIQQHGLYKG